MEWHVWGSLLTEQWEQKGANGIQIRIFNH